MADDDDLRLHVERRYDAVEIERRWRHRWAEAMRAAPPRPAVAGGSDLERLVAVRGRSKPPYTTADTFDAEAERRGAERFLGRLWRLIRTPSDELPNVRTGERTPADENTRSVTATYAKAVISANNQGDHYRTLSDAMAFTNHLYRYVLAPEGPHVEVIDGAAKALLFTLSPLAPHITAELSELRFGDEVHAAHAELERRRRQD